MTKKEIVDYVVNTPHNVNRNILGQQLDELQDVSWNDLKDKPFYSEMVEEDVFVEIPCWLDATMVKENIWVSDNRVFEPNQVYFVYLDGIRYECPVFEIGTHGERGIGNPAIGGYGKDNGIPFLIADTFDAEYDEWSVYFRRAKAGEEVNHVITITTIGEIVLKLNEKYRLDGVGSVEPDMVITISHGLRTAIHANDVSITSGSVEGVSEKLWSGVPVDIRVRGFEVDGSYMAQAAEVKATGYYYGGSLFVEWLFPNGHCINHVEIKFDMDGVVVEVTDRPVLTNA